MPTPLVDIGRKNAAPVGGEKIHVADDSFEEAEFFFQKEVTRYVYVVFVEIVVSMYSRSPPGISVIRANDPLPERRSIRNVDM